MNDLLIIDISIDWDKIDPDSYLRSIPAISSSEYLRINKRITFFVGGNGTGKSTLLEAMAIAYGYNPEGGTRNYHFTTYDSHSELHKAISLGKGHHAKWGYFLRAETFYNVATVEMNEYEGRESIHDHSHGEGFMNVIQKNLNPMSIYFFDEPEAALSPDRQLALIKEIHDCADEGSQFFIITHSPILLAIPDAEILSFDDDCIKPIKYEDTESYKIYSSFLNNRDAILHHLLADM
jgi:predicted ATPase